MQAVHLASTSAAFDPWWIWGGGLALADLFLDGPFPVNLYKIISYYLDRSLKISGKMLKL